MSKLNHNKHQYTLTYYCIDGCGKCTDILFDYEVGLGIPFNIVDHNPKHCSTCDKPINTTNMLDALVAHLSYDRVHS